MISVMIIECGSGYKNNRMCVSMEGECDWIKYKELKN